MLIKINVTENDIKNLSLDQKTEVKISDKNYKGSISYIAKTSDPLTRNFKVEVQIDNAKKIISGLSSEVRINLSKKDAYFLSSSLISLDNEEKLE